MHTVMRKRASRQTGERVVMGDVRDVVFHAFARGDVMSDDQESQHVAGFIPERGDDELDGQPLSVFADISPLGIIRKPTFNPYFEDSHIGSYIDAKFLAQLDGAPCN